MEQSEWRTGRGTGTEGQRECESVYVSRSLRTDHDVISPSTRQRLLSRLQGQVSPACKEEGTSQGGGEFFRDTKSKGTRPPFSSSLHRTQGPAQSNPMGGEEEDRTGARTWFSESCACPLRDSVSQLSFLKLERWLIVTERVRTH